MLNDVWPPKMTCNCLPECMINASIQVQPQTAFELFRPLQGEVSILIKPQGQEIELENIRSRPSKRNELGVEIQTSLYGYRLIAVRFLKIVGFQEGPVIV